MPKNNAIDKSTFEPFMEDGLTPRCQGAVRKTLSQCDQPTLPKRKVCKKHGGNSYGPPLGTANNLKHGMYSSVYNDLIKSSGDKGRFDNILTDPKLHAEEDLKVMTYLMSTLFNQYLLHVGRNEFKEAFAIQELLNQSFSIKSRMTTDLATKFADDPAKHKSETLIIMPIKEMTKQAEEQKAKKLLDDSQ